MVLVVTVNSRVERPGINDRDAWWQASSVLLARGPGWIPPYGLCLAYRSPLARRTGGVWPTISHRTDTRSAPLERLPRSSGCGGAVRSQADRPGRPREELWSDAYVHISISPSAIDTTA